MHVAASTPSCARKPKTFVDDERDFGDGEAIGVEAAAAVMGAALSSVDRFERTRMPACHARLPHVLRHARSRTPSTKEGTGSAWRATSAGRPP